MEARLLFSPDYETARVRFREAAAAVGWELESHPIGARGPGGEELTIDIAVGGEAGSDRVLVISSGIHGVEGYLGSAVQLALLRDRAGRGDALRTVRVVLLHGLNPYGWAWRRRCNEANVDLNRNLLLDGEPFHGIPQGYAGLDGLLNPKRPPSRWEPVTLRFLMAIARYGMPALKQAVASGQYGYPKGLFFGGDRPSRASELLAAHFDRWLGNCRRVMHLDLHTGLGAWASWKLLVDYPLTEGQRQRLGRAYGPDAFEESDPNKTAYNARGSFGRWCVARGRDRDYLYAAAEFGTYRPTRILAGLRAENQAHNWGSPGDESTERAKQRLVELFCPRSEAWRTRVLDGSGWLVSRAIDDLRSPETRPAARRP